MNEATLKPIAFAMMITIMLVHILSKYAKPTTGNVHVDNFLAWINGQRNSMASLAIFVGIVVLFTDYLLDLQE